MGQRIQHSPLLTQSQVAHDKEKRIKCLYPAGFRDQLGGIRPKLTDLIACTQHDGAVTDLSQLRVAASTWRHCKEPSETQARSVAFTVCERERAASGPAECP